MSDPITNAGVHKMPRPLCCSTPSPFGTTGASASRISGRAFARFADLVVRLTRELAPNTTLRWIITDLEGGTAGATATAEVQTAEDSRAADEVVRVYLDVGRALESNRPLAFAAPVNDAARRIRELIRGDIESVMFETAEADALVRASGSDVTIELSRRVEAFRSVQGRVEVLSRRRNLRFTIWYTVFDWPVTCYLTPGGEELMRDAWGRIAQVEGWISRDAETGRAISARRITSVKVLEDAPTDGYLRAKGVLPMRPGDPPPEERLRRAWGG